MHTKTKLIFQGLIASAWYSQLKNMPTLLFDSLQPFLSAHPGLSVAFYGPTVNPLEALIAGSGPDVVQLQGGGQALGAWLESGLLMDLMPYVRQSNVDLEIFFSGQLSVVQRDGKLFGLPQYTGTAAMVVNVGLLDQLGISRPDPAWDYQEWARLAQTTSVRATAKPRYGTTIWLGPAPMGFYFTGWGGGIIEQHDDRICGLDKPDAIACGEFLYNLLLDGMALPGWNQAALFKGGQLVSGVVWQGQTLLNLQNLRGAEWEFYPMPRWPRGAYTFTNENYYAINAGTKNPDAAWELLWWLATQPQYQRALMHMVLWPPALRSLWPEWVITARAVAPGLRGKNLGAFAVPEGSVVVPNNGGSFRYSDQSAFLIISEYNTKIMQKQMSVRSAFVEAAREVNALEQYAASEDAAQQHALMRKPGRVWIEFGPKMGGAGLSLAAASGQGDSAYHLSRIGNRPVLVFDKSAHASKDSVSYLYFRVNMLRLLKSLFAASTLFLTVHYYDAPADGRLSAQYTSSSRTAAGGGAYDATATIETTGRMEWKRVTWTLTQAQLSGSENFGAMFRLAGTPGLAVSSVQLSVTPPPDAATH